MKLNLRRSKSEKQANVLVQGEEGDDDANSGAGNEFEVVSGDAAPNANANANPDLTEPTKLKKQKFSMVRMMSSRSSKRAAAMEETPDAAAATPNDLAVHHAVPPPSPASTANSTTAGETPPPSKKKTSKFMNRLKQKTSDIFKSDDGSERIVVGDEYAIISVKPKTVSWDNTPPKQQEKQQQQHKGQQEQQQQEAEFTPSSMSNEQYEHESGLKKQKFSLLRKFSSRGFKSKKNVNEQ